MPISLQRASGVFTEPVQLAEMKTYLRVDFTDDDSLIQSLITAARSRAEQITGRALVSSGWTYYLDSFPYVCNQDSSPARNTINKILNWWSTAQAIRIPCPPVTAVTSVKYIKDASLIYTVLDPTSYAVDTNSEPCVLYPVQSYYWPTTWTIHNAVQINFTAGYSPDVCPEDIKLAIRLMVANWYENREDSPTIPRAAEYILKSYRTQPVGFVGR